MRKILFDSGIWISTYGSRSADPNRQATRDVVKYILAHPAEFQVCFSERNLRELAGDPRLVSELGRYTLLPYQVLNETWGQVEGSWRNIGSTWGDEVGPELGESLRAALPDKRNKPNMRDRGIFGDAVLGGCHVLLHENPKDFNRLVEEASQQQVLLLDMVNMTADEAIASLERL